MDRVQPPVQWFRALQTLYITLLRKKSGKEGEAEGRCLGVRDTTSSPVVSFLANPVHYIIMSEVWDKEEEQREVAGLNEVDVVTLQSGGIVTFNPSTLKYYERSVGQGEGADGSCQGGWGTTSSPVVLFLANPVHFIIR